MIVVPDSVAAPSSVTASPYVWLPVVVTFPVSVVLPPLPVERFLISVNDAPSMAVVPLKSSARLFPAPLTPDENVGAVPVSVTVLAASVTKPPYVWLPVVVTSAASCAAPVTE